MSEDAAAIAGATFVSINPSENRKTGKPENRKTENGKSENPTIPCSEPVELNTAEGSRVANPEIQ